ncbi:alpha/beta fold hydrolase [Thalassotalea mangrovi]|uniref:Alpha/beta hydrolase n=1 Tax=Thalassotalea mangrovi TaxID=2572245 RepID=A0A4U1B369_9GAMM|nr:alpha/beta hydrolase [Thalassotalea mangrovi]TKB44094.1 alpha/beta hydrolase [Thalassotalea mangrovi]
MKNSYSIECRSYPLANQTTDKAFQIAALELGNLQGQVILCLHGWLDNATSFMPLLESLQGQRSPLLDDYRFIAIDWPGHGLSSHRSNDAHYYFTDWVNDLYLLLESQHWQQVTIIGHSMGAMVANLFTSAFNERVKSLFLIEGIGLLPLSQHPAKQLRDGIISRTKIRKKSRHQSLESAIEARMLVSDLDFEQAKILCQRSMKKIDLDYQWVSDPRVRDISVFRYTSTEIREIITQINCPVTLFFGDQGFESVKTGIATWQSDFQNLESVQLCGGHHVHMEDVETLVQQLTNRLPN